MLSEARDFIRGYHVKSMVSENVTSKIDALLKEYKEYYRENPRPVVLPSGVNQEGERMLSVELGRKVVCSVEYLDQYGNPMLRGPTIDATPAWTSNPAPIAVTLALFADGSICEATPDVPGEDLINVSISVEGKVFTAALPITVQPAPQVLTSIRVKAEVQ